MAPVLIESVLSIEIVALLDRKDLLIAIEKTSPRSRLSVASSTHSVNSVGSHASNLSHTSATSRTSHTSAGII